MRGVKCGTIQAKLDVRRSSARADDQEYNGSQSRFMTANVVTNAKKRKARSAIGCVMANPILTGFGLLVFVCCYLYTLTIGRNQPDFLFSLEPPSP